MIFYLIGINYRTTSLADREAVYRLRYHIIEYWRYTNPHKVEIFTTCNRVEIYGVAKNKHEARLLVECFKLTFAPYFSNAYIVYGEDKIFEHGLRLTCGLESQIQGEAQILYQLESWVQREKCPSIFKELWGHIIEIGKTIRMLSGLDIHAMSIVDIVLDDLSKRNGEKSNKEIIVIGTGKIAALIAEKHGSAEQIIFVAHKRRSKAEKLARMTGGKAVAYSELSDHLCIADAIIGATSSPHYVLGADDFRNALITRKRPLYIYDLAIPRDIAPDVGSLPFVVMRHIHDMLKQFDQRDKHINKCLERAQDLIKEEVYEYKKWRTYETYTDWDTSKPTCITAGGRSSTSFFRNNM